MALPRKSDFPAKDVELADLAKAISHPARIAILKVLAKKQHCICGELVADLPLAQSSVSQHLKALKDAGLITGEISGPKSCYCINWPAIERFGSLAEKFLGGVMKFKSSIECQ